MEREYWLRQGDSPLFPELQWSRPENKLHAGKLLIIGGNAQGFAAPAEAYGEAMKAGIGTARVMLPDSLQKSVSKLFPDAEFAPSNPSGGFAKTALAEVLATGGWADGVLLAGDFGRNSETAIVLESFLEKHVGQVTITKDAVNYFTPAPAPVLQRPDTTLVLSLSQLQKLFMNARYPTAITFAMDMVRLVEALHSLTESYPVQIITKQADTMLVAVHGQVSTTKRTKTSDIWRLITAADASVWWLQNPNKPFEALTTAVTS